MKKKLIVGICLLFVAGVTFAQTVFMENKPWTEVKAEALKAKKMIFMDCYTSWCGPCKHLATNIFPQPEVGDFLNSHFLCCKYDMEKGDGIALHEKYKKDIPGFPTMLVINPADETVIHKVVGAQEGSKLIANLQDGLDGKTLAVFQKRYEAGERSLQLIQDYCKALDAAYDKVTKEKVVKDFVESMPLDSLESKTYLTMYLPYLNDAYSPQYKFVLTHLDKYQYRAKMNRYEIESQLRKVMSRAAIDIVKSSLGEEATADTIAWLKEKEEILKGLLKTDVRGFTNIHAQLAVNDVRMSGDVAALDKLLDTDLTLRATNDNYYFRPMMYEYIIEKGDAKKQKTVIAKYVALMQDKQNVADERSKGEISLFTQNDYDILAIGYYRLGDKKKGVECAKKYDDIYKVQKERMKEVFGEKAASEIDKTYAERIAQLYSKVGIKK